MENAGTFKNRNKRKELISSDNFLKAIKINNISISLTFSDGSNLWNNSVFEKIHSTETSPSK